MVRIQLETGYLDVKEGTVFPLNFGVGEIRDISKRSGTFSKTITLLGNDNNNQLLGHLYDVNIEDGTFNINTLTPCIPLQNDVPIVESCYLQLLSVNKVQKNNGYEEEIEYEVMIKDYQSDFFTQIDNSEIAELDFSEFDHTYSAANVINSFSNVYTDGFMYPLGFSNDNAYTLTEFKPAIYARQYWDKIHQYAGYTYSWAGMEDAWFNNLVIPYNGDRVLNDYSDYLVDEDKSHTVTFTQSAGTNVTTASSVITSWTENQDNQNLFDTATGIYDVPFYINAGQSINIQLSMTYELILNNGTGSTAYLVDMTSSAITLKYRYRVIFEILKNGVAVINSGTFNSTEFSRNEGSLLNGTTSLGTQFLNVTIPVSNLLPTDQLTFRYKVIVSPTGNVRWKDSNSTGGTDVQIDIQVSASPNIKIIPSSDILQFGGTVDINQYVPKNVKMKDFVKSICQMYNLFAYPDPENPNSIIYVHRDRFYDSGVERDWTYKLAKDSEQQLQFLPDLSSKKLILSYKDDGDEPNTTYLQAVKETYGQVEWTFDNEYIRGIDRKEIIFSPSPVAPLSFGAVVPLTTYAEPKTNIRILIHNGTQTCDTFTIQDYPGSTTSSTDYPFVSHFNDPYNPTFDINFGVCDYYFYDGITLTNNNLFNNYWRRTIGQINSGKMLTAYFNLTEQDIYKMQLSDKIRIDNSWWNINKVIDYDANSRSLTKVELMSIDQEIDFARFVTKPYVPTSPGGYKKVTKRITEEIQNIRNVNLSPGDVIVSGSGNTVLGGLKGAISENNKSMTDNTPLNKKVRLVQESFTIDDDDYIFIFTSSTKTATLPSAADNEGRILIGKNTSSGNITIAAAGGETIEGAASVVLTTGSAGTIVSDGVQWWIIGIY